MKDIAEHNLLQARLANMFKQYMMLMNKELFSYELHPGQMPVIFIVSNNPGMPQKDIAKRLKIQASTMTVTLKRMEKSGYITRRPDENDQRLMRIYPTDKCTEILSDIRLAAEKNEKIIMSGFTDNETALFKAMIDRVAQNLSEALRKVEKEDA